MEPPRRIIILTTGNESNSEAATVWGLKIRYGLKSYKLILWFFYAR